MTHAFLSPKFENIPGELRKLPRWVTWNFEPRGPKEPPGKIPYAPDRPSTRASSTDPHTWGTFDQAEAAYMDGGRAGVGIVLNGDGLVGVDIDHCVENGKPDSAAIALLEGLGATYIEFSPSGTGLRAFGYATPLDKGVRGRVEPGLDVELYSTARYLTLTGRTIKAGPIATLKGFSQLAEQIRVDRKTDPKTGETKASPPDQRHAALVGRILSGDVYHDSLRDLAASMIANGMLDGAVVNHLRALMDQSAAPHDARWEARRKQIPALVESAGKFKPKQGNATDTKNVEQDSGEAVTAQWPALADPFAKYAVPAFPVDALPESFAELCRAYSAASGFDVGGYAFAMLVTTASLIDHRAKMTAGPLQVPAHLWGAIVSPSGGGKSPTINAAQHTAREIDAELVRKSKRELSSWSDRLEFAVTKEEKKSVGPKPAWRQLIASDTTVEALGHLLQDNPSGILLAHDELTEWIGRMDAYSGNGGGKDRGVYLRAFDGGSVTINRASRSPLVIENFSVGIITGVQPEKLGEQFRKSGGGSDGLFQRFLMYALQPAGAVNYSASIDPCKQISAGHLIQQIHRWTESGQFSGVSMCLEALPLMQQYHQDMRTLAQRESAKRFAEHLDKFPGFLARVAFALHCMECANRGEFCQKVELSTFQRALQIMKVLYHHSASVYRVIEQNAGDSSRLIQTACEAILVKGWAEVTSGDLTRYATDWRGADDRTRESAIDTLIELGWLIDITPAPERGQRGRRSSGRCLVNPAVHDRFLPHSERIKRDRKLRHDAIKAVAASRAVEVPNE